MQEGVTYAHEAWERAWKQGYAWESIKKHAGEDFIKVAEGAIIGAVGGLALVFVGQMGGAIGGSALGAYVSGGNPAAAIAMGQLGGQIGRAVAMGALQVLGVAFLVEYVGQHINDCVPHLIAAYDLTINQCPVFTGQVLALSIDMASRMIAEAIGIFCGLLLSALLLWLAAKTAKGKSAENVRELTDSWLNTKSRGLIAWLVPKLGELQAKAPKPRPALRVIEGGMPSSTMTPLQIAVRVARSILPKLVNAATNTMVVRSIRELHQTLLADGFKLIKAEPFGPDGGYQLFYQKGNVLARFKTLGDKGGPRAGKTHLSLGYNDGRGLDWQNDLGKFTATGKVEAKVITDPAKFTETDFQGNPQRFVLLPTEFKMADVDAWAGRTHFNAEPGFDLTGLDAIVNVAAP
ncbi:MAG: hypothetical protein HY820_32465 [Acidobacteria bacterium]|nr:hypothetical protein [Acidobacteriota bacterium]